MITGKRAMLDRGHHLLLILRKGQVGNSGDTADGGHDSGSEELQRFPSLSWIFPPSNKSRRLSGRSFSPD
jgi:hypothetical protein